MPQAEPPALHRPVAEQIIRLCSAKHRFKLIKKSSE
jgi:hypothetical protein